MVDYSANGGGNIGVKFKHDRKKYQTAESIKVELETTEVEIQNADAAQLESFVNSICSKLKRWWKVLYWKYYYYSSIL